MEKFHVRLRQIRMQRNKTQQETAEMLEMKLRGYQAYEGGEREPSIQKLIKLADFFDVSMDYLVGRTDS